MAGEAPTGAADHGAAQPGREPMRRRLVAELIRELGLRTLPPQACKCTTVPGGQPVTGAGPTGRDFSSAAPGQRLVG